MKNHAPASTSPRAIAPPRTPDAPVTTATSFSDPKSFVKAVAMPLSALMPGSEARRAAERDHGRDRRTPRAGTRRLRRAWDPRCGAAYGRRDPVRRPRAPRRCERCERSSTVRGLHVCAIASPFLKCNRGDDPDVQGPRARACARGSMGPLSAGRASVRLLARTRPECSAGRARHCVASRSGARERRRRDARARERARVQRRDERRGRGCAGCRLRFTPACV